jgi:hypothetical protein
MNKTSVFVVLFLIQFLFLPCAGIATEDMKAFRDLCPEKKVGICSFELIGADADKNARVQWFSFIGAAVNAALADQHSPYSQELTREFHQIYEEALGKSGFFQLSPAKNLIFLQDGKPLSVNDIANKNNLYSCVKAVSFMGIRIGFNKRVQVSTKWELTKPTGEKVEFTSEAISEDAHGVFVDPTDPKLKPVFLELARQNAQQFLTTLGEKAEPGSCLNDYLGKMREREKEKTALEAKNDSRFIYNDNGTVADTKTDLMWAAKDNGSDMNWAAAKSYCENYRGGGYTDWRMPTKDDLKGLYDAGKARPLACDKSYQIHVATSLIDVTCFYVWASDTQTHSFSSPDAAYFYFIDGGWYWSRQSDSSLFRALPVRSVKSPTEVTKQSIIDKGRVAPSPTAVGGSSQ